MPPCLLSAPTFRLEIGVDELARSRARLSKSAEESQLELGQTRSALLNAETQLQRRASDVAALERQVSPLPTGVRSHLRWLTVRDSWAGGKPVAEAECGSEAARRGGSRQQAPRRGDVVPAQGGRQQRFRDEE